MLLVLFLINTTSQLWVFSAFYLNRDYVAANLCINRFDAESGCNGACVLERELAENEEHQQKSADLKGKELVLYIETGEAAALLCDPDVRGKRSYPLIIPGPFLCQYIPFVFRPPAYIV